LPAAEESYWPPARPSASSPAARDGRLWPSLPVILLLAVAHTSWYGYRFGDSNLSIQVPLVQHYADRSLYVGDPLMDTLPSYPTWFVPLMGHLVRAFGRIELVYFLLFYASLVLGLYALARISILLFAHRTSAVLVLLLGLVQTESLGGELFHNTRFTHSMLASSLLLWAFFWYLSEREERAFLLTGLVFNLHGLYAAFVAAMLGFDTLVRARRLGLRTVARRYGVFLLAALPGLIWTLRASEALDPAWVELLRTRSEHHSFPLNWKPQQYVRYATWLAFAGLGLGLAVRRDFERVILRFALAVALLCGAAIVFTEWFPLRVAFQGQFFRSTRFLTAFALIYAARAVAALAERGRMGWLVAATSFLSLFLPHLYLALLPLVVFGGLILRGKALPLGSILVGSLALVLAGLYPVASVPSDLAIPGLAVTLQEILGGDDILLCAGLFTLWWFARGSAVGRTLAVAAILGVVCFHVLPSQYASFRHRLRRTSWVDVQLWAREHSPRSATFLTPPDRAGFRVFSERAIVGEWKDGTQQYFSTRFTFEWWRRMQDLRAEGAATSSSTFETLAEDELLEIAQRYGARYLVFPLRRPLGFSRAYQNRDWVVYRLTAAVEGSS
jgi:hypothetical protein